MACVSASGKALAPISRLMARVWGHSDEVPSANMIREQKDALMKSKTSFVAQPQPKTIEKEATSAVQEVPAKTKKEVNIDSTTALPTDLYWNLLRAGERAKNRGQHSLKVPRGSRTALRQGHESPRPRLVMSCA
eukprot:TRINITY_DN102120_c0_g1_i1.p1 TRINITY_DN102120_c0_g1~~TRINITY_DN102120_c0_g1_i1.p1  ORF type:complete len:134 (-),score=35.11 TRINITY_DN102120_c0_g1_i1:221-622(-)